MPAGLQSSEKVTSLPQARMAENVLADRLAERLRPSLLIDRATRVYYEKTGWIYKPIEELDARCKIEEALGELVSEYTNRKLNALISLLNTRLLGPGWTTDHNLIPMKNGVFDWREKILRPYSSDLYFNWQLDFRYDSGATCPDIDKWLEQVTGNNSAFAHFLLCWMTAIITGRYDLQKFLIIIGHAGSGKGVYFRLLQKLVGPSNIYVTDLRTLEENRFETSNLRDCRLTVITESAEYTKSINVFKQITGEDPIRSEKKNKDPGAPFLYTGMVAISGNHSLNVGDKSGALSRRQSYVFFSKVVSDEQKLKDPDFETRLHGQISGLFNRLIGISHEEVTHALRSPPSSLLDAKLDSELQVNPIMHWLHERVVICQGGDETSIGNGDKPINDGLFSNYRDFCISNGEKPVPLQKFSHLVIDACVSHGIDTRKGRGGETKANMIVGLRLRDELKDKEKPFLFVRTGEGRVSPESLDSEGGEGGEGF